MGLTTELSVAEFFACVSAVADRSSPGPYGTDVDPNSAPVVIVLEGLGLLELNYELSECLDGFPHFAFRDWENEIACWKDIRLDSGDHVLVDVLAVPSERIQHYLADKRAPFVRIGPQLAGATLAAMENVADLRFEKK